MANICKGGLFVAILIWSDVLEQLERVEEEEEEEEDDKGVPHGTSSFSGNGGREAKGKSVRGISVRLSALSRVSIISRLSFSSLSRGERWVGEEGEDFLEEGLSELWEEKMVAALGGGERELLRSFLGRGGRMWRLRARWGEREEGGEGRGVGVGVTLAPDFLLFLVVMWSFNWCQSRREMKMNMLSQKWRMSFLVPETRKEKVPREVTTA